MSKMVKCKNCKEEVDAKAFACPKCGVKIGKAFYKKPWFIILAVIVVIAAVASGGGDEENKKVSGDAADVSVSAETAVAEEIIYEEYTVKKLLDDLSGNALKAENTYDGKNVKLTGKISVIDSDGDYISLEPSNNSFTLINVTCNIKNDEQLQTVMELSKGQNVTVYGKITDVGELLGYILNIDKIEY